MADVDTQIAPPAAEPAVDIAAIIAKQGVQTSQNTPVDIPDIHIKPEEPASTEPQKQEPTKAEAAPQPPAPEIKAPIQEPEKAPAPVQAPAAIDWKQEVLKQPEIEVLKALGFDDKMTGLVNTWKTGGDLTAYLREATTDYSKMTGEELMRHQLKQEYGDLNPEDFEELYQAKVVDAYKLDPDMYSEKEIKRGQILLNADTKKIREALVEKQKQFILDSKPPEPRPDPAIAAREEAVRQSLENYEKEIKGSDLYKGIMKNKILSIELEGQKFNYEIPDFQRLDGVMFDDKKWGEEMLTKDGSYDPQKQALLGIMATDPIGYLNTLAKFFIEIGSKKVADAIENVSQPGPSTAKPDAQVTSPAAALAKAGRISG